MITGRINQIAPLGARPALPWRGRARGCLSPRDSGASPARPGGRADRSTPRRRGPSKALGCTRRLLETAASHRRALRVAIHPCRSGARLDRPCGGGPRPPGAPLRAAADAAADAAAATRRSCARVCQSWERVCARTLERCGLLGVRRDLSAATVLHATRARAAGFPTSRALHSDQCHRRALGRRAGTQNPPPARLSLSTLSLTVDSLSLTIIDYWPSLFLSLSLSLSCPLPAHTLSDGVCTDRSRRSTLAPSLPGSCCSTLLSAPGGAARCSLARRNHLNSRAEECRAALLPPCSSVVPSSDGGDCPNPGRVAPPLGWATGPVPWTLRARGFSVRRTRCYSDTSRGRPLCSQGECGQSVGCGGHWPRQPPRQ